MKRIEVCKVCMKSFEVYLSRPPVTYCSVVCKRADYRSWHPIVNKKYIHPRKDKVKIPDRRFKWSTATEEQKIDRLKNIFNSHVIISEGCWGWSGKLHKSGYAVMVMGSDHKQVGSHRISWLIHNGEIPDDKLVLHKCDNPSCTNPNHLFLGSYQDNTLDMVNKGRSKFSGVPSSSKLNIEKVKKIKELLKLGVSMVRISKDFEMSHGAISAIKKGITWKYVIN